jgi:hypothetical protein
MTTIISVEKNSKGFRNIEWRSHNYIPEGFILVPPELTEQLNDGWCSLDIRNGVLTGVVPEEKPEGEGSESGEEA